MLNPQPIVVLCGWSLVRTLENVDFEPGLT